MRVFLAAFIVCIAFPALAQVQATNATLLPTGMVRVTLSSSIPVQLTQATLVDSQGQTFELSDAPRGVKAGPPSSCKLGAPVNGTVFIPFKPHGTPPYTLALEFETPDSTQMFGCRAMNVSLDGVGP